MVPGWSRSRERRRRWRNLGLRSRPARVTRTRQIRAEGRDAQRRHLFGERSLRRAISAFEGHYHVERNHQGRGNKILFPAESDRIGATDGELRRRERLGGTLQLLLPRGWMSSLALQVAPPRKSRMTGAVAADIPCQFPRCLTRPLPYTSNRNLFELLRQQTTPPVGEQVSAGDLVFTSSEWGFRPRPRSALRCGGSARRCRRAFPRETASGAASFSVSRARSSP
jgi:hypothetical protein